MLFRFCISGAAIQAFQCSARLLRCFCVVPCCHDFQLGLMLLVGRRTVGCRRIADVLVSTWGCAAAGAAFRGSACWRLGRIELRRVSESSHDDERRSTDGGYSARQPDGV